MNEPECFLSYDSSNEYDLFPSDDFGPTWPEVATGRNGRRNRVARSPSPVDRMELKMIINELLRKKAETGETIAEYEAGKLRIRLIESYCGKNTIDELLYFIACNKLSERVT